MPGDTNRTWDLFVRGPDPADLDADLSRDGFLDDVVLEVLDTTVSPVQRKTLLPAAKVAVAAGSAAFLVPTEGGAGRVHLSVGGGAPEDLGREALDVAFSRNLLAARVPAPDGGEAWVEVCDWPTRVGCWTSLGVRAKAIDVVGSVVGLLVPECGKRNPVSGSCIGGAVDGNGDGDAEDHLVQVYRVDEPRMIEVRQAAEELVLGERLVAFRTREASQGEDLNRDGDLEDDALQVFDLVSERLFNTEQAVTPCPLKACDARFPYRVDGDTVIFITPESQQSGAVLGVGCQPAGDGGCDLNGDGDSRDLVKQVFRAREAALLAGPSPTASLRASAVAAAPLAAGGCVDPVASASAGICTTTGAACATSADCGTGSCYLPPGGCIADLGASCRCGETGCTGCDVGQFCVPIAGGGGNGTCHQDQGPCASQAECTDPRAVCRDAAADVQRLLAPTELEVVTTSGTCVELTGAACTQDADCTAPDLCGTGGRCERRHGSCVTDADCATGLRCAPNLVTVAAAESDGDALLDPFDNCPEVANADQADLDADGAGDACDLQSCGNGRRELSEQCDDGNRTNGDCCSDQCRITDRTPPVLSCSATPIRTPREGRHDEEYDRRGRARHDDDEDEDGERGARARRRLGDEDDRCDNRSRRRRDEDRESGDRGERGAGTLRVAFAAGDACGPVRPESAIDLGCSQVPVSDGQLVAFERSDDCEAEPRRRALEIESESAVLRVHATDAAGNTATCTVDLAAGGEGIVTAEPVGEGAAVERATGSELADR